MAINPSVKYAGKITAPSVEYPLGKAQNITVPGDGTGTPWEKDLLNDIFGFQQALLGDAGEAPSGIPDKVGASQYLKVLFKRSGLVRDDYTELRATKSSELLDLTNCFIAKLGIGGAFQLDKSDVVSLDDKGTIIVDADGGRWKRLFSSAANSEWFGTVGASDDSAFLIDAFDAQSIVEIPFGKTVTIDSTITLANEQTLIVNGTLNGSGKIYADNSFTLIGRGEISILTPGDYNITFRGGVAIAGDGLTFNGSGYAIGVRPSTNITRLEFDNIIFDGMNYGVLRNIGTVDVFDATISNIKAVNMTGDPIEWNLGNGDRRLTIHDIFINDVDATLTNQGIGVGVAGGSYDLAYADNMEQFEIYNVFASALRQAVHVEAAQYFKIHDIFLTDISTAYSATAGLDATGVAIYGCRNFEVYEVYGNSFTGANLIGIIPGVIASTFTYPCYDYKVHDIHADNAGAVLVCAQGQDKYCHVSDVTAVNGSTVELYGKVSYWNVKGIDVLTAAKTVGFEFDYEATAYNAALNATKKLSVVIDEINVRDTLGQPYTTLTSFAPEHLDASNCNFTIESTKSNRKQCQRTFYIDAGTFPYGIEYQEGDIIHDIGGTPQQYLVTTAGSRNRGADNCEVYDQANKLLKSTNYAWTGLAAGGNHEIGQEITISNIGAAGGDLVTRIVRVFIAASFYQIEVEDAITAVDTTAGTITATNPVVYTAI